MRKVFVEVVCLNKPDGSIVPQKIVWEDGHVFQVDRVLDVRQAASLLVGGCGIRYTCRIHNKETYLFYEEGKWFVEGKK